MTSASHRSRKWQGINGDHIEKTICRYQPVDRVGPGFPRAFAMLAVLSMKLHNLVLV